jgi:ribulose-5-phosphate 4-epimerase/fuculose-1-phosphate aldolase
VSYPGGDLRDQLAHAGAQAVHSGLVVGSGGNLSAREPGTDACWVTATDTWLDRLDRQEFSLLRITDGAVLDGHPTPSSEWRLHTHTYRARPDVNAVIHLHPQTSVLLAALGHEITLVTTDHSYYAGEVVVRPYVQPGTEGLAQDAADAVAGGANAVILGHHGAGDHAGHTGRRHPGLPARLCRSDAPRRVALIHTGARERWCTVVSCRSTRRRPCAHLATGYTPAPSSGGRSGR